MAFRPNRNFGPRPFRGSFPSRFPYNRYDAPGPQDRGMVPPLMGMAQQGMPWGRGAPRQFPGPSNGNFRGGGFRGSRPRGMPPKNSAPIGVNNRTPKVTQEAKYEQSKKIPTKVLGTKQDEGSTEIFDDTKKELAEKDTSLNKLGSKEIKKELWSDETEENVVFGSYDCDLHFNTDSSGLTGWTLHEDGFEYLWGGARASHGATSGKVNSKQYIQTGADIKRN